MATIQKRKKKNGATSYRVMIRPNDGLPIQYKTFPTNQEAKDWAIQEEAKRRQGLYFPEKSSGDCQASFPLNYFLHNRHNFLFNTFTFFRI